MGWYGLLRTGNDHRFAAFNNRDDGVGRPQIDAVTLLISHHLLRQPGALPQASWQFDHARPYQAILNKASTQFVNDNVNSLCIGILINNSFMDIRIKGEPTRYRL